MKAPSDLIHALLHKAQIELQKPKQHELEALLQALLIAKQKLADWQALADLHQRDVLAKYLPLRRQYAAQQALLIQLMDEHAHQARFTPEQKDKLSQLIRVLAQQVLAISDDQTIAVIQQRHSSTKQKSKAAKNETTSEATREYDEFAAFEQQAEAAAKDRHAKKQAAKDKAKQARAQEASLKTTQSVRAVYRDLVTILHPDREPDPHEQQRKTALLQQVNVAYQQQDLLKLLELQLAAEQFTAKQAAKLANERLEHYRQVLSKQLQQVQAASQTLELGLKAAAHLRPSETFSAKRLKQSFKVDVKVLQQQLAAIQPLLHELRDLDNFKQWLNYYDFLDDV